MTLPFFTASDDPGPSFMELLHRVRPPGALPGGGHDLTITHGTTVLGVRYADGVVMAGDRRAPSGNLIARSTMEKVFPADRFSGVAIAGAAGPAMEMVKLFQLQLEHYEKVEGNFLSLEGKANQLGQMVRGNLPAAMQGLAVVPIFAGYDVRRQQGRLFRTAAPGGRSEGPGGGPNFGRHRGGGPAGGPLQYDVTGGRYEESNFASTGSGSLHAGTVVKLGYHPALTRGETIDLVISALFQAADEDSA